MKNARFPLSSYQRQHTRAATLPKNSSCALDKCLINVQGEGGVGIATIILSDAQEKLLGKVAARVCCL